MTGRSSAPRHVVITGASSGLGRALAVAYATTDRTLSLGGRDAQRLAAVADECARRGATVSTAIVDVTDPAAMESWLAARDAVLPIDVLIANAGMGGEAVLPGRAGESGRLAREIFAVNTLGVVNTVTPVLAAMVNRGTGHVVLVSSISAYLGLPQSPAYCGSKAAVKIYGDGLRRLVRPAGVRVTNVLPGFMDTPMSQSLVMARPWYWEPERAAARIVRDIGRGAAQCVFPWQLRLSIGLQNLAPNAVLDLILSLSARHGPNRLPSNPRDRG